MKRERIVTLQTQSATRTAEGRVTQVWTADETAVWANMQPLSGQMAREEYGLADTGYYYLFFTEPDSRIHAVKTDGPLQRIVAGNVTCEIRSVEVWPDHFEIVGKVVA